MDLDALARDLDERITLDPAARDDACLFGLVAGTDELVPLASGAARELAPRVRPPGGLGALVFVSTGWAAPLDDGSSPAVVVPSEHRDRRRMRCTVVVTGHDRADVDVCTVLRVASDPPLVLRGGEGVIHDALIRCWHRRRDAHLGRLRAPE